MTPQIARKVMDQFRQLSSAGPHFRSPAPAGGGNPAAPPAALTNAEPLSEKEERLLELIAEGMTNRQIAAAISLAEGTVKNYISRIMEKLHANTRTELAMLSRRK
jgi:DNA-binding NarL/FixJ family response regulator